MDTLLDLSTKEAVLEHCSTTGRTYVQMTLGQADKELGSIFLELYTDLAPSTCANFLSLVNGTGQYHYKVSTQLLAQPRWNMPWHADGIGNTAAQKPPTGWHHAQTAC